MDSSSFIIVWRKRDALLLARHTGALRSAMLPGLKHDLFCRCVDALERFTVHSEQCMG